MSELSKVGDQPLVFRTTSKRDLSKCLRDALGDSNIPFEICLPNNTVERFGRDAPEFRVTIRNEDALKAVSSLNEVRIAESYLKRDIDFDGNLLHLFE